MPALGRLGIGPQRQAKIDVVGDEMAGRARLVGGEQAGGARVLAGEADRIEVQRLGAAIAAVSTASGVNIMSALGWR